MLCQAIAERMIGICAGEIVLRDEGAKTNWKVEVGAFRLASYPVTRELYRAVRGEVPASSAGPQTPVTEVCWKEAVRFCNLLWQATGLEPCYSMGDDPDGQNVVCNWEAEGLSPFPVRGGVGVRVQGRDFRRPLRRTGRDRLVPRELRQRGARRRGQAAARVGSVRHDRQRVGVVLGCL
jgi:hypothetical protein